MSYTMDTDIIEHILMILGVVALSIIMLALYLVVIIASAYAVEWIMDWLSIGIDRTIYWTGVAILILFCAFGKTKVEKGD